MSSPNAKNATRHDIATSFDLWGELVDTQGLDSRTWFDATPISEKLAMIDASFGTLENEADVADAELDIENLDGFDYSDRHECVTEGDEYREAADSLAVAADHAGIFLKPDVRALLIARRIAALRAWVAANPEAV